MTAIVRHPPPPEVIADEALIIRTCDANPIPTSLAADCPDASFQRGGPGVVAHHAPQLGVLLEIVGDVRMVRSERPLVDLEGAFEELLGLRVETGIPVQTCEIEEADGGSRMPVAEDAPLSVEGLEEERFGLVVAFQSKVHEGQVGYREQGIRVVVSEQALLGVEIAGEERLGFGVSTLVDVHEAQVVH